MKFNHVLFSETKYRSKRKHYLFAVTCNSGLDSGLEFLVHFIYATTCLNSNVPKTPLKRNNHEFRTITSASCDLVQYIAHCYMRIASGNNPFVLTLFKKR